MELMQVQNWIYDVRGRQVMIDFQLAELYQVETRRLKEQVKRNIERFPADFMFQLTKDEWSELISICDKFPENIRHTPTPPSVFTQEGVAMLSGVLRSDRAIEVNISIMRAFVAMRQAVLNSVQIQQLALENKELRMLLEDYIEETEGHFDEVFLALSKMAIKQQLETNKPRIRVRGFQDL